MESKKEHCKQLVKCHNCGDEFLCQYWRLQKRQHMFCSKKCESEYKIKHRDNNCTCFVCGKTFHKKPSNIHERNFCSIKCVNEWKKEAYKGEGNHQYGLKGQANASWKSDERISYYGYKLIRVPEHPLKNSDDMVFEHRLIAEQYLLNEENSIEINNKQYLKSEYSVHHIDFNRLNNDVNNLLVISAINHQKLHWIIHDDDNLKLYCDIFHLDFDTVLYNKKHSKKYQKTKIA